MAPTDKTTSALLGFQRQYLKRLAHELEPVVQVGQAGVTASVLAAVDAALLTHELIKVRLLKPEDKKAMAQSLAAGTHAELCGLVGHTVILYRQHPKEPVIHLPQRRG